MQLFYQKFLLLFLFVTLLLHSEEEEIRVSELKGLVFSSSLDSLDIAPSSFPGITISNLYVPRVNQFVQIIKPFLGKPISKTVLEKIRQTVVIHYQKSNYPIVAVIIPADQDISKGYLKILVMIGTVGEIKAEGAKWFSNERIAKEFKLKKGDLICDNEVLCNLYWINRNPFYKTNLIFEPGEETGETDILLCTKDRFPLRVYTGYENTGNLVAGTSRYLAGFNYGNLFGRGHQLNGLFLSSSDVHRWWALTGNYTAFFPWQDILEISGAYTKIHPDRGPAIDLNGIGWQVRGKYDISFCLWKFRNKLFIGYEFKRTNNFLNFANTLIFDNFFDISQFLLGYRTEISYPLGVSVLQLTLYFSPGNMTAFNKTSFFLEERQGTKASYIYGLLRYDQTLRMPKNFSWVMNFAFQQASTHLLPLEEFPLGGYFTVRGYDENEVIGDNGILLKNEIRTPFSCFFKPIKQYQHHIQLLAFVDFGVSYDVDQNILSKSSTVLASVGPGLRYNLGPFISFRVDYGRQLKKITRLEDDSKKKGRFHLSLIVGY